MINRARFTGALERFHSIKALCLGDVMLDQYFYGSVHRVSPEAPVPVLSIESNRSMLGGAGNVARNIASLEGACSFFSVAGADASGSHILQLLSQEARITSYMITDRSRVTTTKLRYVADDQHMLRADHEVPSCVPIASLQQIIKSLHSDLAAHDVIVLSDYRKGIFTDEFCDIVMQEARKSGKPVVVDTKARDFKMFAGATIVTPNIAEMQTIAGRVLLGDDEIAVAAEELIHRCKISNVLVTRGADGMLLITKEGDVHPIPAAAEAVCDVSGAGDTVVATLALGIAAGLSVAESAYLANIAAGIVVQRAGTTPVSMQDLRLALLANERLGSRRKIMTQGALLEQVQRWKREGKRIGFTNGCFDLLHAGHLHLLQEARELCDKLIVGLNSDASVRMLKGEGRPVNDELNRALMLSALLPVDAIALFEEETPESLIRAVAPHCLFKGDDWGKENIAGAKFVEASGGNVIIIPRGAQVTTTQIIQKLKGIHLAVSH